MYIVRSILIISALIAVPVGSAFADIKGPNGEKCDSSSSGVKHDIKDKHYTCDKCTFSKCDASGNKIDKCQVVTHWANCVEDQPAKKK